ncbi:MAG TPA: hypothetical protein VF658_14380 [Pyrinomonadaceae bacterium]|jgi:hypothetical protein
MAESVSNNEHLVFGEFLAHLRQYGFTIGIDHHLRLHELLDKAGGACGPHDLKTLLCPIFATDSNQQESFYRAFDAYFNLFKPDAADRAPLDGDDDVAALVTSPQKPKTRGRRKWLYLCGVSLLVLCLVGIFWLRRAPSGVQEVSGGGSLGNATLPQADPSASATPSVDSQLVPSLVQDSQQQQPGFLRRHKTAIVWSSLLLPLALFLLYEWHRFRRRKLTLHKQRGKKPPYVWSIRTQALAPKLYDSEQFYRAARSLRRRHVDEFYRLDVDGTISATIEALGFPNFRYKLDSKPPEYLALIERASARDHQAQLFKALTKELEREDIFVERYFYDDGDPRVCCGERGEGCLHLVDLQHKFAGYRLLVFGNGELMIDPVTGRLKPWTKIFAEWPQKALLTPESPAGWSFRELSLAEQFTVLPATPDGLSRVVDHFEAQAKTDLRNWRRSNSEQPPPLATDLPETIAALRSYLGEQTFQWLCACAVYPELQWDLTLFLGTLPCLGENLLRDENLLRLVRLPWFRTGSMPDDLRWALINELDGEKEKAVRLALIELLENNPPPKESFAADSYQLNLVVQRWLSRRDRKRRREMLEVVKDLPPKQVEQDYTLMRFLESASFSSPTLFLPSRLRKIFYHHGYAAFGLKTRARLLMTLAFIALLQFGIYESIPSATTTENKLGNLIANAASANNNSTAKTSSAPTSPTLASSPIAAYKAFQEANKKKDYEAVKKRFSKASLRALIEDAKKQNKTLDEYVKDQVDKGTSDEEVLNEKIDGDSATVELRDKNSSITLPMVKEDGEWKIAYDIFLKQLQEDFGQVVREGSKATGNQNSEGENSNDNK